ncbi:MAG: dockerin type I repeat-containing protein [Clostridia bacterium]|nr:dockerin type I repeat-containing protein [Clostridia bacterium]
MKSKRLAAALLALLFAAFGLLNALPYTAAIAEEDDEYDMIAYAYTRWVKFNSSDPAQWTHLGEANEMFDGFRASAAVAVGGVIYVTPYDYSGGLLENYLYRLDGDMHSDVIALLSIPELNLPSNGNYPSVYALTYAEDTAKTYALVAVGTHFALTELNLSNAAMTVVCMFPDTAAFYPITMTYCGGGRFYMIEAYSNSLILLDPSSPESYETVMELPEMASLSPIGLTEFPHIAQSLYYDSEANTLLWGAGRHTLVQNGYGPLSKLVKIDLSTNTIIYDIDMRGAHTPCGWYNWPLNCFIPVSSIEQAVPGDADGDGNVSVTDAVMILRYAMGLIDALPRPGNADIDGDGAVTVADAILVLRGALGTA